MTPRGTFPPCRRGPAVAHWLHVAVGRYGSRVSLVIKADIRPGYTGELTAKVDRLEEALADGS